MSVGMAVHTTSIVEFPWICGGSSSSPGLRR